jgi:hypothetical protein
LLQETEQQQRQSYESAQNFLNVGVLGKVELTLGPVTSYIQTKVVLQFSKVADLKLSGQYILGTLHTFQSA